MDVPLLELVNATVVKRGIRALDNVTFTIQRGQHTAIVGPNGSGKSTLVNLLTLEDRPFADGDGVSAVRVCGGARWNVSELRQRIGIVSADLHHRLVNGNLAGRIVASDAVLSGLLATHGWIRSEEVTPSMRKRSRDTLARLGVEHLIDTPLNEMSTGEARRVVVARALVHDPEILVLDEPTGGLDMVARRDLLETMRAIARQGTTLVVVTHRLEEIVPEVEQVVLLRRGRIAAAGPTAATLTAERLSTVFDAPIVLAESGGFFSASIAMPTT
jgi:iron complex transport system ATP-binding protein